MHPLCKGAIRATNASLGLDAQLMPPASSQSDVHAQALLHAPEHVDVHACQRQMVGTALP